MAPGFLSVPWELSPFVALEIVAVTAQSLAVGLVVATPWEGVQSFSEVQSSVSIVGYLPLAPVKIECVSLTGGQVRGHLDAGASEFVSQVLVVQYHHLVPPSVELDYERAGLVAPLLWGADSKSTVDVCEIPAWRN